MDEEELIQLVATAVGVPALRPSIERVSSFAFAAQIADRYRNGRGFVVGDAAHRMTPRGGTGMNTAIQDAYDLGWKLGWLTRSWAGPELLGSYETDRRPVGVHNVDRAGAADGARRSTSDALPWDLHGRVAHHWIRQGDRTVSTLDLLTDGLTLLAGPNERRWIDTPEVVVTRGAGDPPRPRPANGGRPALEPGGACCSGPTAGCWRATELRRSPAHRRIARAVGAGRRPERRRGNRTRRSEPSLLGSSSYLLIVTRPSATALPALRGWGLVGGVGRVGGGGRGRGGGRCLGRFRRRWRIRRCGRPGSAREARCSRGGCSGGRGLRWPVVGRR